MNVSQYLQIIWECAAYRKEVAACGALLGCESLVCMRVCPKEV